MIKDPWPLNWKMPVKPAYGHELFCMYSKRKPMMCAANRRYKCRDCYIKQMSITDEQNKYRKWGKLPQVVHYCDRCGRQIGHIDRIIYLEPENREGTAVLSMELCYMCALQLFNWAGGEDFLLPEADDDLLDYFYPLPEERPKPKRKRPRKSKNAPRKHTKNYNFFKGKKFERYRAEHPEDFDEDGIYIGNK